MTGRNEWLSHPVTQSPGRPVASVARILIGRLRDDVTKAEQALKTARLEHAALGYENALDGSQVAQMLVGSGLTVY